MDSSCNIRGVLEMLLAYCCQSSPYFQWDVKCLNVHKFGLSNGVWSLMIAFQPLHLYLKTILGSNILGTLSLKVKKRLTLTGDVKMIS